MLPPLTVPGVTALVDGFLPTEFCIVILVGVVATIDDPQPPPDCQEQDFKFAEGLGKYTAADLEGLTEMALGEAGFRFFDRREIEALIATAVNRQTYNIAYFFDNSRPHFVDLSNPQGNPAPTQMLDILSLTGYVAFAPKLGTRKVNQQRLLNLRRYGRAVLFEGDVACDQLKSAKQFAIHAGTLTGAAVFELYPVTFNHAGIAFEPGRRRSANIRRYGSTTFWNHIFGPPQT